MKANLYYKCIDELPYADQDMYSATRRQLMFDEDVQQQQQQHQQQNAMSPPARRVQSEPRFVTFVKEAGSVGIRLTGN